ncbi:uncharacterized protein LOC119085670 [Bradysia coprophila]|uniref:uncharacterized protein LOC119085670 n=1 Tax=Bradysia coprophila TaxID=38358 RepID=UPI00187D8514|nr:uncharacterized protein LOC119085670 [Bradysia coprophila]
MRTFRHPFSFFRRSNELMNNVFKFDVHEGGKRIGQIVYGVREPTETCLKIFHADNTTQLVVRSLRMGEFSVFRDESSPSPLCIINSNPLELDVHSSDDFRSNIEFYSEAKITTEEQKLCTGAAFANKICEVQRSQYFAQQLLKEGGNANPQKKAVCLKLLFDYDE